MQNEKRNTKKKKKAMKQNKQTDQQYIDIALEVLFRPMFNRFT